MPPSVPAGKKDWTPPLLFAEYQLLWLLGRGGMGEVYLGHDKLLDRPVAIKFISTVAPDDKIKEQYLTEARAAARLQHPNVVTVHRVGEIDGRLYIVSEYVRGQTLELVQKPLPGQQAHELGMGLARGLAEAHRRGVLHRDIKPGNAILADNGEIKLLDFGLAKCVERSGPLTVPLGPVEISEGTIAPTIDITDPAAVARVISKANEAQAASLAGPLGRMAFKDPGQGRGKAQAQQLLVAQPPAAAGFADSGKTSGGYRMMAITSSIKGTPMYMAPEVLSGLAATQRSDVYSMGAVLFELCAGVPPHYDVPLEQLQLVVPKRDAPPINHIAPAVDPRFGAVIDRCLRRNSSERYASAEQLLEALEQLLPSTTEVLPEGNPYRGLWPFEEDHRALFFGRRSEVGTLLERLRSEPCIVLSGESGLGKTSLCRAGILPLVRDGMLDGSRSWLIASVTLGRQPLRALVSGLSATVEISEEQLHSCLSTDPSKLAGELSTRLPRSTGLLLFVDQLEELVTCANPEEARAIALGLSSLLFRTSNLRLLTAVRSDYVARVGALPGLAEAVSRCLHVLRPLSAERLRDIVVGPATAKGVRFESSALVNSLIDSMGHSEGGLPLLQLVLAELWEAHDGSSITPATLEAIGGVSGALTRHADHVIGSMLAERRSVARRIFCALALSSSTPASCLESELLTLDPGVPAVLESLARSRLLFARSTADGTNYELAHVALRSGWPTLQRWLAEPNSGGGNPKGTAERATGSTPAVGEATAKTHRLRYAAVALAIALALLGYGGLEVRARVARQRLVAGYVQQGQLELKVARSLKDEMFQLQDRAFTAFEGQQAEESEHLLTRAHSAAGAADRAYGRASHQLEAALNIDGSRTEVRDTLADILYERALAAELDHQEGLLEDLLQRLSLYDTSGQRQQAWSRPGRVTLTSTPPAASVQISRCTLDEKKRWTVVTTWNLGSTPLPQIELDPGRYIFFLNMPGFMPIRRPILVGRAANINQHFDLKRLANNP